jgi:hypothetical protein
MATEKTESEIDKRVTGEAAAKSSGRSKAAGGQSANLR